jgi:hypothetical protein
MDKLRAGELVRSELWQHFCKALDEVTDKYKDSLSTEKDLDKIRELQTKIAHTEFIKSYPSTLAEM